MLRKKNAGKNVFSLMYMIAPVRANGIYVQGQGQLYSMNQKTDGQAK